MEYCIYIIYSPALDKFYVGSTQNFDERLKKHLSNHKGYTSKAKDWILAYQEFFTTREEAIAREHQIKSWKSRKKIVALITVD